MLTRNQTREVEEILLLQNTDSMQEQGEWRIRIRNTDHPHAYACMHVCTHICMRCSIYTYICNIHLHSCIIQHVSSTYLVLNPISDYQSPVTRTPLRKPLQKHKQNNIKQTNAVKPTKQTYRKPNTNKLQTCNIGKLRPRPGRRASCVGRPSGAQPATQKS